MGRLNWRSGWKQYLKGLIGVRRVADLPTSAVLWSGSSELTGDPIMAIASRIRESSSNGKTGDMVQVYILPLEIHPARAWHHGGIAAVCPDACAHRSDNDNTCYVAWARLGAMWTGARKAIAAGEVGVPAGYFKGAIVRFGAGGDPSAAPLELWQSIASEARGWSGYTANWRDLSADWALLFMASVSTLPDLWRARSKGWRIYAASESADMDTALSEAGVKVCPSHTVGLECVICRQCDGTSKGSKRPSYYIPLHGIEGSKVRRQADSA